VGNAATNATDPSGLLYLPGWGFDAPPDIYRIIKKVNVQLCLYTAWIDSNPNAPNVPAGQPGSLKKEQGGWIIWDQDLKTIRVVAVNVGTGSRDSLSSKKPKLRWTEVICAKYHTHPNKREEGYSPNPSPQDKAISKALGIPEIIISHVGIIILYPDGSYTNLGYMPKKP
jgi:hypothetical protein